MELYKIKLNNEYSTNSGQIVQVNHLKKDLMSRKLFGTTRISESSSEPKPGLEIHIFIVGIKNDGKIDSKNINVKKVD